MRARMLWAAAASAAIGVLAVHAAPRAWRLEGWHGVLLGTALYMGVIHRWIAAPKNADARDAFAARDLVARAAIFVALLAIQAYAYFEWLPPADLRAPFVFLSGWIVTETLVGERSARRA